MRRLQQVCLANLARLSKDFKQSPAIRGLRRAILPCAACVAVWRILAVLWKHDNLSHRELSELTSIEVSSLSRISKTVQRDGLIRRKRTVQDQRTVRVTLTTRGERWSNRSSPGHSAARKTSSAACRRDRFATRIEIYCASSRLVSFPLFHSAARMRHTAMPIPAQAAR